MTTNDEAAERLIDAAIQQAYDKGKADGSRAERRATVERIRVRIEGRAGIARETRRFLDNILAEEAER